MFPLDGQLKRTDYHVLTHRLKPNHAQVEGKDGVKREWNSREHRKGRHPPADPNRKKRIVWLNGDLGNISWWVGMLFTMGSVVWCINGCFIFLPLVHSNLNSNSTAIAWSGWVGGTIFIFGAYAALLEAINRGHEADFGMAIDAAEHHLQRKEKTQTEITENSATSSHRFHTRDIGIHQRKQYLLLRNAEKEFNADLENGELAPELHWAWLGSRFNELGFDLTLIQMCAATVFWISVVTGLPNVLPSSTARKWHCRLLAKSNLSENLEYWLPQVIGGCGFIISAGGFMLETQKSWWRIEPFKLGWHVGFWNLIGGIGFTLCGALGFANTSKTEYQSGLSTFWGSWAFLIGSYAQWFEGMNSELVKLWKIE